MISGLLQLEAESGTDKAAAGYLHNAITRIQAIAQVHNLLSREMAGESRHPRADFRHWCKP